MVHSREVQHIVAVVNDLRDEERRHPFIISRSCKRLGESGLVVGQRAGRALGAFDVVVGDIDRQRAGGLGAECAADLVLPLDLQSHRHALGSLGEERLHGDGIKIERKGIGGSRIALWRRDDPSVGKHDECALLIAGCLDADTPHGPLGQRARHIKSRESHLDRHAVVPGCPETLQECPAPGGRLASVYVEREAHYPRALASTLLGGVHHGGHGGHGGGDYGQTAKIYLAAFNAATSADNSCTALIRGAISSS